MLTILQQLRNAVSFVAASAGIRERLSMAWWLALFLARRSIKPAEHAVRTLSFRGLEFCLDWNASEHVPLREILIRREYWPEEAFHPSAGQTVVDVGANAGVYAVYAATRVGERGRVIAVEPNPVVVERLRKNVSANRVQAVCEIVPVAVSSRSGVGSLDVGMNTTIGRVVDTGRTGVQVPRRSLDEIIGAFDLADIDVMKIDVEGAELDVIKGGRISLRRSRRIVVEVDDATEDGVAEGLRAAGFDRIFAVNAGRDSGGRLVFGERRPR